MQLPRVGWLAAISSFGAALSYSQNFAVQLLELQSASE
jgi:hypothetical protein